MLGVDMVEKYFGSKQEEFIADLKARGFDINPTANFEALRQTQYAIPILMNPYSYDEWIHDAIFHANAPVNHYLFKYLRMNSELQYAFAAQKYALNIISGIGGYYYYPILGGNLWFVSYSNLIMLSPMKIDPHG